MRSYFRFLWKHKALTVIQIIGISMALSFAIPAVSLMLELRKMNRDNPRYEDIYGVKTAGTMSFAGEDKYFIDKYPEVEAAAMFLSSGTQMTTDVIVGNTQHAARTMRCNADIAGFFPVRMISGSIESVSEGRNIILSKEFAASLSDENLLGSTVLIKDESYLVSGILDGFESRRIPYADIILSVDETMDESQQFFTYTFVRLRKGTDIAAFEEKVRAQETELFASKLNVPARIVKLGFERYDRMALTANFYWLSCLGPDLMIILGSALSLLLLFAFSNYANLSVAMSSRRAREMATKRLLGSSRSQIRIQIVLENIVFTAISFLLGFILSFLSVRLLHGLLSAATQTMLLRSILVTPEAMLAYLLLILVIGTWTGMAPARAISRHAALDVVKGEFKSKEKKFISKLLIVLQGIITVALIFTTLVERAQIRHNLQMDFGCDIDNVYSILLPSSDNAEKELVMQALRSKPYVMEAGYAESIPGFCYNTCEVGDMYVSNLVCDREAFSALGFRVREDYASQGASTVWISQQMKDRMNGTGLSGGEMDILGADVVGGTIEKFLCSTNMESGYAAVTVKSADAPLNKPYIVLRTSGDHREVSKDMEETVNRVIDSNAGRRKSSSCFYVRDLYYDKKLRLVETLLSLMKEYLIIMLALSLLGILGISTYNMQIRKHDIAIRKVLGSSTMEETLRNTRSYAGLMIIANVLGLPLGYLLRTALLQSEVSKVAIAPWMFIVTCLFTVAVVVAVCMIQSYCAACMNPVDSIQSE